MSNMLANLNGDMEAQRIWSLQSGCAYTTSDAYDGSQCIAATCYNILSGTLLQSVTLVYPLGVVKTLKHGYSYDFTWWAKVAAQQYNSSFLFRVGDSSSLTKTMTEIGTDWQQFSILAHEWDATDANLTWRVTANAPPSSAINTVYIDALEIVRSASVPDADQTPGEHTLVNNTNRSRPQFKLGYYDDLSGIMVPEETAARDRRGLVRDRITIEDLDRDELVSDWVMRTEEELPEP